MMDALQSLLPHYQEALPVAMLICLLLLTLSGYPVAFILGALALGFAAIGLAFGVMDASALADAPREIINGILLNPSLIAIPVLVLLAELAVSTGQMAQASKAIKGLFDPEIYRPEAPSTNGTRSARRDDKQKEKKQAHRQRSMAMAWLLPAGLLLIIVAYQFGLPSELLAKALLVPIAGLFCLYLGNWLTDLWMSAFARRLKAFATHEGGVHRASPDKEVPFSRPYPRPWGQILPALLLPLFSLGLAIGLLFYWPLPLFADIAILCIVLAFFAALQLKLHPAVLFAALSRSALASASLFAMLIMAATFHSVFLALGGARQVDMLTELLGQGSHDVSPLLMLMCLLVLLMILGLVLDWMIMALIILPLSMPLFSHCDFGVRLMPLWEQTQGTLQKSALTVHASARHFSVPEGLWLAALVWLALLSALITFGRQNGEIAQKELVSWTGKIKDSPASTGLFVVLQIIGLIAIIIVPQLVLWLPSVVF
nr:hypothetical protein [uncultured Cohaesibacter sp.]